MVLLLTRHCRRFHHPRIIALHRCRFFLGADLLAPAPRLLLFFLTRSRLAVVRALPDRSRLQVLFHQVRATALRTLLRHRFVIRGELAFRIIRAPVEVIAATGFFLRYLAVLAKRAGHPDGVLLDVSAFGIAAA